MTAINEAKTLRENTANEIKNQKENAAKEINTLKLEIEKLSKEYQELKKKTETEIKEMKEFAELEIEDAKEKNLEELKKLRESTIDELKKFKQRELEDIRIVKNKTITEANHVIHFSRHWNPAKEDQATDRAFRIGQTKTVYVYTLIGKILGITSFDEKLDYLLSAKQNIKGAALFPSAKLDILETELINILNPF